MASSGVHSSLICKTRASSFMEITYSQRHLRVRTTPFLRNVSDNIGMMKVPRMITRTSSELSGSSDGVLVQDKTPFGYTKKDVLLIGLEVTLLGYGLKSGLELVLVLGLTVGWISTHIFWISNKEMTYAQQLHNYESKVMEKRLESSTETELQVLLEQVEEEKTHLTSGEEVKWILALIPSCLCSFGPCCPWKLF